MASFLNKIKTKPDHWLFFLFLFTFSFGIRKVLFYFPIERTFNEYTGLYVYLSDIFLIAAIGSWLAIVLSHTNNTMSRAKLWITCATRDLYTVIPIMLCIYSFLSILWSTNQDIAIFRSFKLIEFVLLYFYIRFRIVPFCKFQECSTRNILFRIVILTALFQSIIAIIQFISQKSLGLTFLRESIISPEMPGVAKIIINNEPYIRAYGLMPHPNILGGFLLFSIILALLSLKLLRFENKRNVPPASPARFAVANARRAGGRGTLQKMINRIFTKIWVNPKIGLIKATILIQFIALILTFSKLAIIGLIIALSYIKLKNTRLFHPVKLPNVPRGTLGNNGASMEHSRIKILLGLIFTTIVFFIIKYINLYYFIIQPMKERLFHVEQFRNILANFSFSQYFFGSGVGQYIFDLSDFTQNLESWQYQPIHNVYLLIWSELGLIGIGLFFWFLWKLFHLVKLPDVPSHKVSNCSTPACRRGRWNNLETRDKHETIEASVEQKKTDLDSTNNLKLDISICKNNNIEQGTGNNACSILHNKYNLLSINIILVYFKAILLGFLFIMLFDHYFWTIQQGSLMLWIVAGIIAGIYMSNITKE